MYRFICQLRLGCALTILSAVLPYLLAAPNGVTEPAELNNPRCEDAECVPALCHNAINLDEECCLSCPYYTPVFKVTPHDLGTVTEGQVNNIVFNIKAGIHVAATAIVGRDLWNVNVWASASPNGNGDRIGYTKQALSEEQAAVPTIKKYRSIRLSLSNIKYELDATDVTCSEIKYLCVEFGRGDNPQLEDPRLPFTVEGVMSINDRSPASENLIGCKTFSACNGGGTTMTHATEDERMGSLSSSYDEGLLPCSYRGTVLEDGQSLTVDECTVCLCDNSTLLCNIQGCPIISCSDGQEPVIGDWECCESCPNASSTLDETISTDDPVGCEYRGHPVAFGGYYVLSDCTTCYCQANRIMSCEIRSCPSIFCDDPIEFEGECCDVCPYYASVWQVQPSNPTNLTEGKVNDVMFNLMVEVNRAHGLIKGRGLWKVSSWTSSSAVGEGKRIGFTKQVLTDNQSAKNLVRPNHFGGFLWKISDIKYALNASDATCLEMKYLCVELAKGDSPKLQDPRLSFIIEGVTNEHNASPAPENLRGCSRIPSCEDKMGNMLDFSSDKKPLPCTYKGRDFDHGHSLTLNACTVCTCNNSIVVCNIQICQIISCRDGQEAVKVDGECCETCPASTIVDGLTSVDYPEVCMYQGNPVPIGYYLVVDDCTTCHCQENHVLRCEISSCPSLILCGEPIKLEGECCKVCPYYTPVYEVSPLNLGNVTTGQVNNIVFHMKARINAAGTAIAGRDLWNLNVWASDNPNGNGNRIGYKKQVLSEEQAAIPMVRSLRYVIPIKFTIPNIEYVLDATDVTCSAMKYLCVEFGKGNNPKLEEPRLPFTFEGVTSLGDRSPAPEKLIGCETFTFCNAASGTITHVTGDEMDSSASGEFLLPCSYKGTVFLNGQSITVNECIVCSCVNSTTVCNIQSCPIISCSDGQEPVVVDGDCCETCPDAATTVDGITSKDDPDGCKYQGGPVAFGDYLVVDECTTCYCQANRILRCEIRSCPSFFCRHQIYFEGECCSVCPYYVPVWQVQPSNLSTIAAGKVNDLNFNLTVEMNNAGGLAIGRGLWKVSSWTSTSADGGGQRFGFTEQVLTGNQSAENSVRSEYYTDYSFTISDIEYSLDASNATCSEMNYFCVELARGDDPKLHDPRIPFTVEGVSSRYDLSPAPGNLRSCSRVPSCEETSAIRNNISFSVAKKSSQNAETEPVTISWNHVYNNAGDALNSETGIFKCSVAGSYFFTFLIAKSPNTPPQIVKLIKNDEFIVAGLDQRSTNSADSTGNTVILDLDVNDLVWLELYHGGEIFGSPERFSTFSGFLIYPS